MDCVNHHGVSVAVYCQHCGKPLCQACVRKGPGGEIFCEPCWTAWQGAPPPFVPLAPEGPSPGLAAVLGAIPGVGAMYNGQFVKGMVHVVIFAVLVSAANVYDIFGLFIAAWIFYQDFHAYHTARARRDGDPLPDPLGLNELSHWFTSGTRPPPAPPAAAAPDFSAHPSPHPASYPSPAQAPYQAPGAPPIPGAFASGIPPMPPAYWRRREPIGAVVLIGLGVMFLLNRFNWFSWHIFAYGWPLLLIGLGVWLIVRRLQDGQGGPRSGPQDGSQGGQL